MCEGQRSDIEIVERFPDAARGAMPPAANRSYKDPCNYETTIVNYKYEMRLMTSREDPFHAKTNDALRRIARAILLLYRSPCFITFLFCNLLGII